MRHAQMSWFNIDVLPTEEGMYHVMREWDKDLKALGQAFFDGTEWKDVNMDDLAGPIVAWMPLEIRFWEDEMEMR